MPELYKVVNDQYDEDYFIIEQTAELEGYEVTVQDGENLTLEQAEKLLEQEICNGQ